MGDFSVKAILSAVDRNFSSTMKSAMGTIGGMQSSLTSGIGFGVMAGIGQQALSSVMGGFTSLTKETIGTSDSLQKLQQAMRFGGSTEAEIQRIAGATGSLSTYADKTVFDLNDVMSTFGALSANGIKDADKMTEAVGNAVAVFGGGATEFSSVGLAYSQAMASGALHAQDWNQILNASPQLAGGLRKELIKLNPTIGNDFKGAMEKGAITADLLGQAMNNIGMTDMAKEAAQSVTTFEGAMGNFQATVSSGIRKIYDSFAKTKIVGAINSMNSKVSTGFDWLVQKIPSAIDAIAPYWEVFKTDVIEVKDAFGDAVSAIAGSLGELNGAFGSDDSIKSFGDALGVAKDALVKFAGFLEKHADTIAKVITHLPQLLAAYMAFKAVKTVFPVISTLAGLFGGIGEKAKEAGDKTSSGSKKMLSSAKAFAALGAGVFLISAGFYLLAQSAIQLAEAGPLAIAAMAGLVVSLGALLLVAKSVAPALSAGAVGFIAFGAAVMIAGVGMFILSSAAISLAEAGPLAIGVMVGLVAVIALLAVGAAALGPALIEGGVGAAILGVGLILIATAAVIAGAALNIIGAALPVITQYGASGAVAIAQLALGMVAFGAGALVAGAGCVVLGAGLMVVAVGLTLVGAAVIIAAAGVLLLAAGVMVLGTGMTLMGAALMMAGAAFPLVASGALLCMAGFTGLLAMTVALVAALTLLTVPLLLISTTTVVASAGMLIFGVSMVTASAGTLIMAAALKSVNSSMKTISSNAASASESITSMVTSIDVVNAGLDSLGSKAKSAVSNLVSAFSGSVGRAQSAATSLANGFTNGVKSGLAPMPSIAIMTMTQFNSGLQSGGSQAVAIANSMTSAITSALRSAASGAYSCGYNIGAGLASGMAASLGEVQSMAAQLAAAAEKAIRAKAEIHSPSRVTTKLGEYWGVGFVNGIKGKVKDAARATKELVTTPNVPRFGEFAMATGAGSYSSRELRNDYSYKQPIYVSPEVPVYLDGREVARGTAKYTNEEIEKMDKIKNRLNGVR